MKPPLEGSATALARAIRERALSPREAVEAHLRRIDEVNPTLRAVVALRAEEALREADAAGAALDRGEPIGPLHGVPITIKDSFDTAGLTTTWGTFGRLHHIPPADATIVARLKSAGAIVLGKTHTPELTLALDSDDRVYAAPRNPYDASRSPGGSSGGPAAIVAAGGSALDVGSDTGGSIRVPAHFCGTAGIRPTSGRVPRTGHAIPPGGYLDSLTQIGPIGRYVEDVALALPILAGPDGRDPSIVPMNLGAPEDVDVTRLRVSFHVDNGVCRSSDETAEIVRSAAASFAAVGATVDEVRPPGIEESFDLFWTLIAADGFAWLRLLLERSGLRPEETSLEPLMQRPPLAADEFARLFDRWDGFRRRMLEFIDRYDLIVCPVSAQTAWRHDAPLDLPTLSYTMAYNLTGWPAAVVRAGASTAGLPIGVQLVARAWREDIALATARHVERALGGYRRPPL